MTAYDAIPLQQNSQTWANDGSQPPEWVWPHMVGNQAPNGTFLIETPLGSARVHVGHVVVGHASGVWCRDPAELAELINGLEAEVAPILAAIGPGKAAQFGTKAKAKTKTKRSTTYRPPIGSMPSIEWVHVAELSVDPAYQRSINNNASRRLISSIAANFDWRLCAPLVVSRRRDGAKVIIDGQHRWSAALQRGDLPQLPCCIFSYDSPADEARMFIVANRARKPMNRLDDFHAAIAAGDEDAIEIQRLVSEAGLKIAPSLEWTLKNAGTVSFTSSIAMAIRKHGAAVVSAALTCVAEAFRHEPLTSGAPMFGALVRIFAEPPQAFDPDALAVLLAQRDMAGWGAFVQGKIGGEARTLAMCSAILQLLEEPANKLAA